MSLLRSLVAASVAVALALPALVQGVAVIQVDSYYSSTNPATCAGDPSGTDTQVTGVCSPSIYYNSASKYFCDTSYAYYVTYADKTCTTVQQVNRTPMGCLNRQVASCVNATQGPAYPYAFPVSGFGYARRYLNSSTQDYASCPVGAGTTGYTEYSSLTGCQTDTVYNYSSIEFCATLNGATVRGSFDYKGRGCENGGTFNGGSFYPLCREGKVYSCDNSPSLPSIPSVGQFSCADDTTPSYDVYAANSCVYGDKYTCAGGNVTYMSYGNNDCTGAAYSVHTWVADGKTCQQYSQYDSSKYIFTCDANSLITAYSAGSVAAASWSLLIVGAFAAVFGSRQ